jgi:hypothetical protein
MFDGGGLRGVGFLSSWVNDIGWLSGVLGVSARWLSFGHIYIPEGCRVVLTRYVCYRKFFAFPSASLYKLNNGA